MTGRVSCDTCDHYGPDENSLNGAATALHRQTHNLWRDINVAVSPLMRRIAAMEAEKGNDHD